MKKILTIAFAAVSFFFGAPVEAGFLGFGGSQACCGEAPQEQQQDQCCNEQAPADQQCGVQMCRWVPQYYNTYRTEYDTVCTQRKCCRMVDQEYEKCCVKYVPQYYTQKCCRKVPEYYYVTDTKQCPKKVCEKKCRYVKQYYYKPTPTCEPQAPACCN